jgi:uncharacterized protein (DUF1697 family)
LNIVASINRAKNGIQLTDNSGGTLSNFTVANGGDGLGTADKLKIALNTGSTTINSGDLHLQTVGYNTNLADLNGGAGVALGKITITNSQGKTGTIDLSTKINGKSITTIGDVIQQINNSTANVQADINDTGDGIVIRDLSDGAGTLKIVEAGSTTAKDLNLLGEVKTATIAGQKTQSIDGSTTRILTLTASDTLESLAEKINNLGGGLRATILNDGSGRPYRLSIIGNNTGLPSRFVMDSTVGALNFVEAAQAQDALLYVGPSGAVSGILASSHTNTFSDVLKGASLTIQGVSRDPITILVTPQNSTITTQMQTLVTNFNQFQKKLTDFLATRKAEVLTKIRIEKAIGARLGVATRVTVLTQGEVAAAVRKNPLAAVADDPARLLVMASPDPKALAQLKLLLKQRWAPEALALGSRVAYLWCAEGIVESPLWAAANRQLGDEGTARNLTTMTKLLALMEGS